MSRSVVRKHHGQAAPPQTRHSIGWILYKQLLPLNRKLSSATGSAMLTSPSPFVLSAARQPGAAAPSRGSRGGPPSVIVVPTTARSTPALLESRTGSIRSPRQPFRGARVVVARTCLMFAGDCRLARPIRRSRAPRDLPARGILRRRAHNKKVRGRASELSAHLAFEDNGAFGGNGLRAPYNSRRVRTNAPRRASCRSRGGRGCGLGEDAASELAAPSRR